jgi:hypothetical protein
MKYNAAEMKRTSHQKKTDHRSGVGAPLLMSEVLSSPGEADRPLYLQEYWALDLIDFFAKLSARFCHTRELSAVERA